MRYQTPLSRGPRSWIGRRSEVLVRKVTLFLCCTLEAMCLSLPALSFAAGSESGEVSAAGPCGEAWGQTQLRIAEVSRAVSCLSSDQLDLCEIGLGLGTGALALHTGQRLQQKKFRPELQRMCDLTGSAHPWVQTAWAAPGACVTRESHHRAQFLRLGERMRSDLLQARKDQLAELKAMEFVSASREVQDAALRANEKELQDANKAKSEFLKRNNVWPDASDSLIRSRYDSLVRSEEYATLEARRAQAESLKKRYRVVSSLSFPAAERQKASSHAEVMRQKLKGMDRGLEEVDQFLEIARENSGVSNKDLADILAKAVEASPDAKPDSLAYSARVLQVQTREGAVSQASRMGDRSKSILKSFQENPVKWKKNLFTAATGLLSSAGVGIANAADLDALAKAIDCSDPVSMAGCLAFGSSDTQAPGCAVPLPAVSSLPRLSGSECMDLNPLSDANRRFLSLSEQDQQKFLGSNPQMCQALRMQARQFAPRVLRGDCNTGKIEFSDGTRVTFYKKGAMDFSFVSGIPSDQGVRSSYKWRPEKGQIIQQKGRTQTPFSRGNALAGAGYEEAYGDFLRSYGSFVPAVTEIGHCCRPSGVQMAPSECARKFPQMFAENSQSSRPESGSRIPGRR